MCSELINSKPVSKDKIEASRVRENKVGRGLYKTVYNVPNTEYVAKFLGINVPDDEHYYRKLDSLRDTNLVPETFVTSYDVVEGESYGNPVVIQKESDSSLETRLEEDFDEGVQKAVELVDSSVREGVIFQDGNILDNIHLYDNTPKIIDLFDNMSVKQVPLDYSVNGDKTVEEEFSEDVEEAYESLIEEIVEYSGSIDESGARQNLKSISDLAAEYLE
jgi:hypothetical protein